MTELETLRALLKEAGERLDPCGFPPMPRVYAPGEALHERIAKALAPKPAPLPYTSKGTMVIDANGVTLATLAGGYAVGHYQATAEFIARACTYHQELVDTVRANAPELKMLLLAATGERLP